MVKITISDGVTTIEMPRTKRITDVGTLEYVETTMASGKKVRDIIGFRPAFKFVWDMIPVAKKNALLPLLRTGGFFTVDYPDVDGTDKSGVFSISYPAVEIFKFVGTIGMWHNYTLIFRSQEVV